MRQRAALVLRLAVVPMLLVLGGCDDDDSSVSAPAPVVPDTPVENDDGSTSTDSVLSFVRVLNGIGDAPTLYAQIEGGTHDPASFGRSSQGQTFSDPDGSDVLVRILYRALNGDFEVLIDDYPIPVVAGHDIYLALSGSFASPVVTLIDNEVPPLVTDADGNIIVSQLLNVQFAHTASKIVPVDVYLTRFDEALATATPTLSISANVVSPPAEVVSGNDYRVRLTRVGETEVVYDSGNLILSPERNQLFLLHDYFGPGDVPVRVAAVVNGATTALVNESLPVDLRLVNLISNVPSIDLYFGDVNDAPEFDDVDLGEVSDFVTFDPIAVPINVTPGDDNLTFLLEQTLTLSAGQVRTLVVAGDPMSDVGIASRSILEDTRPVATALKVQMVHTAASLQPIDFYLLDPGQPFEDANATISGAVFLANANVPRGLGAVDIVVTLAGSETVISGPTRLTLSDGNLTVFLRESTSGGPPYFLDVRDEQATR